MYSQEEIHEILARALERQHKQSNVMSASELAAVAQEIGIDASTLQQAIHDITKERKIKKARAEYQRKIWGRFFSHLITFLCVNALLIVVDFRFTGGSWFYWPLLGWGIGLLLQLRHIVFLNDEALTRKLADRYERMQTKQRRKEEKKAIKQSAKQLESAVHQSVAELLSTTAQHLRSTMQNTTSASPPMRVETPQVPIDVKPNSDVHNVSEDNETRSSAQKNKQ